MQQSTLPNSPPRQKAPPRLPQKRILPQSLTRRLKPKSPNHQMHQTQHQYTNSLSHTNSILMLNRTPPHPQATPTPRQPRNQDHTPPPTSLHQRQRHSTTNTTTHSPKGKTLHQTAKPIKHTSQLTRQHSRPKHPQTLQLLHHHNQPQHHSPNTPIKRSKLKIRTRMLTTITNQRTNQTRPHHLLPSLQQHTKTPTKPPHLPHTQQQVIPMRSQPRQTQLPSTAKPNHRQRPTRPTQMPTTTMLQLLHPQSTHTTLPSQSNQHQTNRTQRQLSIPTQ